MPAAAVITADIVNSTLLTKAQEKKLFRQLETELEPFRSEFYRGDSFQVYLKNPAEALMLVLKLRLTARQTGIAFDIRASVGIGEVITPLKKLGIAGGEAFVLSGRGMDELGKPGDQRILIRSVNEVQQQVLDLISLFTDHIFKQMTSKQARVIAILLDGGTQTAAAKAIKKSQSTISKHVQAAGWTEISKLLNSYQQLFK